ncbi:hypothetical protein [Amycolatopsis jejuensis]|uniref:hypothetical protein n=1 Tax=Amycolatopsis jejuensis TaxID=330084 RepID=UPI000524A454|nr:hypothetical protein [Amycolatopsis jejuensis]
MRTHILRAARELLTAQSPPSAPPVALNDIAAQAGITLRQLRTYYTSIAAIETDLHTQDRSEGQA